jgi:hypothetical protein
VGFLPLRSSATLTICTFGKDCPFRGCTSLPPWSAASIMPPVGPHGYKDAHFCLLRLNRAEQIAHELWADLLALAAAGGGRLPDCQVVEAVMASTRRL